MTGGVIGTGAFFPTLSGGGSVRHPILGLFLGTASSLAVGGPAGLFLSYALVSTVCLSGMLPLNPV
jgi:amino acid permease